MMKFLYYFFRALFIIFYKLCFRYEVRGAENVPARGGAIIAANHLSYLDPPLVGIAIKRKATYMARSGLFRVPLIGKFVATFSFPVDRDNPRPSTIKEAVRRLRSGELIVMFPEGTRSVDGTISPAKRGVAIIAGMSMVPVVPALIEGTGRALPVGARFIRPAKVKITFGRPIGPAAGESVREFQERVSLSIMDQIRKLNEIGRFQ